MTLAVPARRLVAIACAALSTSACQTRARPPPPAGGRAAEGSYAPPTEGPPPPPGAAPQLHDERVAQDDPPVRDDAGAMDCLSTARDARVRVAVGVRGCFGGSDSVVVLERGGSVTREILREWVSFDTHRVTRLPSVPRDRLAGHIEGLLAAVRRKPIRSGCSSTTKTFARVTFTCDGATQGPIVFETYQCDFIPEFQADGGFTARPSQGYAPALGIHAWAQGLFAEHANSPLVTDPPREQEKTRKKWGSLYEGGMRVRHDPIEDWSDEGEP